MINSMFLARRILRIFPDAVEDLGNHLEAKIWKDSTGRKTFVALVRGIYNTTPNEVRGSKLSIGVTAAHIWRIETWILGKSTDLPASWFQVSESEIIGFRGDTEIFLVSKNELLQLASIIRA